MATIVDNRRKKYTGELLQFINASQQRAATKELTGMEIAAGEKISKRADKTQRAQIAVSEKNAQAQVDLANIAVEKHNATIGFAADKADAEQRLISAQANHLDSEAKKAENELKFYDSIKDDPEKIEAYHMAGKNNLRLQSALRQAELDSQNQQFAILKANLLGQQLKNENEALKSVNSKFAPIEADLKGVNATYAGTLNADLQAAKEAYVQTGNPEYISDINSKVTVARQQSQQFELLRNDIKLQVDRQLEVLKGQIAVEKENSNIAQRNKNLVVLYDKQNQLVGIDIEAEAKKRLLGFEVPFGGTSSRELSNPKSEQDKNINPNSATDYLNRNR